MNNHSKRGRVTVHPLDSAYRRMHYKVLTDNLPNGWKPEALCDDGLLARSGVGILAIWSGRAMLSVDTNKAEAALRAHHDQSR